MSGNIVQGGRSCAISFMSVRYEHDVNLSTQGLPKEPQHETNLKSHKDTVSNKPKMNRGQERRLRQRHASGLGPRCSGQGPMLSHGIHAEQSIIKCFNWNMEYAEMSRHARKKIRIFIDARA